MKNNIILFDFLCSNSLRRFANKNFCTEKNTITVKNIHKRCIVMPLMVLTILFTKGNAWGQVTYTLGNTGYYTFFTSGTAGGYANSGTAELGMYANTSGNKQVVAWRNFKTAGDNTGSNRSLQVGDVFTVQVYASAATGSIGFSLNATPSTGSWANRHSNSRLYIQVDGTTGSWYVNSSAGNQSLNYNVSTTGRDYQFRVSITSLTTCDVELYVGGSFHSRLANVTMNGTAGANISHFVLYLNDDYNGSANTNIYWKQTTTHNASGTVNLGYYLPSGTYTPGLVQNGLTSASTSTSNTNVVNVGGDAGSNVVLSQANTYSGTTTVNANATLKLGVSSSSSASGPVGTTDAGTTVTSGGVLDMNGFSLTSTATEALTLNGTGISSGGALINSSATASTWAGTVALGSNASIGGSGNITISGAISGANNLTKVGAGSLTLSTTNTFGGSGKSLTVAAGTVAITSFSDNLGDALNTVTLGTASTSGTLEFTQTTGNVSRSITVAAGGGTLKNLGSGVPTFAHSSGTYSAVLDGNLTINCSSTGDIVFNMGISGTGGIIVNSSGSGKVLLQPASAGLSIYTGSTTVTSGSLYLRGANLVSNSSNLILNGGTFGTGVTTGYSETLGTLQLTDNSTIALGTGAHTFTFSASNAVSWTAGRTLTISGWSGTPGTSGTAGKIFIGSSSSGLTVSQLSQITFTGFGEATILSTGEVVPKPAIYRSAQSGNWSAISTWESSSDNGSTWASATLAPGSDVNTTITIRNNHTVSQNNNYNIGSNNTIIINAGGTLNMTSAPTSNMTFSSMTVNGTLVRNNSSATYEGTIAIGDGGKYVHDVNGGSVPTCTWSSGSTLEVIGITTATSFSSGGTQSFHHVVWNCPSQTSIFNFGGLTTVNGNFTLQSTGASPSSTSCLLLTNSTAITSTVAGNLTLSGGFFAPFGPSTASSSTLNISGNLTISGGTFDIYRPSSNTGTINLSGDFSMTSGTLTRGGSGTGNFNFSKTGTQTYSKSGGTISNAINFTVNNGSILSLGTSVIDGSTCTFTLSSGAGLITSNSDGISTSGASGSIQVSGSRTYNTGANYTFNGSSAQSTGDGFTGANNLTINNAAGVTLTSSASLAGTLTLTSGTFTVGSGNTITVTNNGSITQSSGSLASGTGGGTFTFSGTGTVSGTIGFNNVNIAGGVNFGSASTINGTLTINAGGFVNTNAPTYASGSILKYNSGGTYGRSTEWSATSGKGYPFHVEISNSTTVNLGANSGTATARQIAGNLTVNSGSTLSMALNAMTAALTVKGDYINSGSTILSSSSGGDLILEGDLTDNATFTANGRAVFFHGSNIQEVNSTDDPLDIDVVRFNKTGGEVVLLQNLLIDETADPVQFAGTSILNLNGKTATFGKANTTSTLTMNSSSGIKGNASSNLTILGNGDFGTIYFDQTTPGTTNQLGTLNINRASGSLTLGNAVTVNGSLTLTSGKLNIGSNTLTLGGTVAAMSASNSLVGSATSNLTITGTGSLGTLFFDQTTTGTTNNINTFSLNRTSSGTINIANHLRVGSLSITAGEYVLNANQQLTVTGTLTNNGTLTLENGATLVQTGSTPNAGGGTYNVKQGITGSGGATPNGRGWYMGSPVSGASSSVFNPSTNGNKVFHWNANQASPNWSQHTSGATMDVGKGYAVRIGETSSTITFSSTTLNNAPSSSEINVPCYKQTSTTYQGYNLVCNPFPSYLDWNDVWTNTNATNFESTIYYRVANGSNVMVFDTYNALNGQGTSNSNVSQLTATRYIPPMQAFWVKLGSSVAASSNAVNLTLDNSMRDHYTSVASGWTAGLKSTAQDFPMFLRLNIEQGSFKDQMLVFLKQQASSQYDAYDSEKMFLSGYPQVYTKVGTRKLVFNGLNSNKKITVIPVIVDIPTSGVFTFRADEFNVEDGLILLEDKQEGITQDLTINDIYTFYADAGTISNRFFIRFHQLDPSITAQGPSNSWVQDENEINEGGSIVVATNGRGKVTIQQDIYPLASEESHVVIRDAAGREVMRDKLSGLESIFQLDVPSGVYFVEVQLNGQVEVKKIFVQQ